MRSDLRFPQDEDLIAAVRKAPAPFSVYIRDYLYRRGFGISAPRLLRRLRNMTIHGGFLEESRYAQGSYGKRWKITEMGDARFPEDEADG